MLHRPASTGIFIISQPAHSWISGRLARAWGNDLFGQLHPQEDIILAAALHDIGFLDWEHAPTLNPETGWPHTFMDLPTPLHLDLWSKGINQLRHLNRYATLLVSLHYTGLTERHPVSEPSADVQLQKQFLADQRALQKALLQELRDDPYYAPFCEPAVVDKNSRYIPIWDWMSLVFGMGKPGKIDIENIPTADGSTTLTLTPDPADPTTVKISPWPFHTQTPDPLQLSFEARHLPHPFTDQEVLRAEIAQAPVQTITTKLLHG